MNILKNEHFKLCLQAAAEGASLSFWAALPPDTEIIFGRTPWPIAQNQSKSGMQLDPSQWLEW